MQTIRKTFISFVLLGLAISIVQARGFYTPIYSANQLALSGAIMTMPKHADITAINPAGLVNLTKGIHVSTGLVMIDEEFTWEGPDPVTGKQSSASTHVPTALAPTLQVAWRPADKNYALGIALKLPYLVNIGYDENWPGREILTHLSIRTPTISPNFSYQINENHAVAIGYNYTMGEISLAQKLPANSGSADLNLSGTSDYWNFAYLGRWTHIAFAAMYTSKMNLSFKNGSYDFSTHTSDLVSNPKSPFYLQNSDANLMLNLPWVFEMGLGWKDDMKNPKIEFEFGYYKLGWSVLKRLQVNFDKDEPGLSQTFAPHRLNRISLPTHFRDSNNYRIGIANHIHPTVTIMVGTEKTQAVLPEKYLTPAFPAGEIFNLAWGAEFKLTEDHSFTFEQNYRIFQRITSNNTVVKANAHQTPFTGSYQGRVQVASLSYFGKF